MQFQRPPTRRARRQRALLFAATALTLTPPARAIDTYFYNITPAGSVGNNTAYWNTTGQPYNAWFNQTTGVSTGIPQPTATAFVNIAQSGTVGVSNLNVVFNSTYTTASGGLYNLLVDSGNSITQSDPNSQMYLLNKTDPFAPPYYGGHEWIGVSGTATYTQSAGTNTAYIILGSNSGSVGTYNLSGGSINGNVTVGAAGSGVFYQSGGSVSQSSVFVGRSGTGTYIQSGGYLDASLTIASEAGGHGSFVMNGSAAVSLFNGVIGLVGQGELHQQGGNFNAVVTPGYGGFCVGYATNSNGLWDVSGGRATVTGSVNIGFDGAGLMTLSNGTITLAVSNSVATPLYAGYDISGSGTVSISGGTLNLTNTYLGYWGVGNYIQSAGTVRSSYPLYLGYNAGATGTVNLSGGSMSVSSTNVGYNGNASFTQSAGTHTTGTLSLGVATNTAGPAASGTYSLSGGALTVTGDEIIGAAGTGIFNQSGGVHVVGTNSTGNLYVSHDRGGQGTLNLSGGTLTASHNIYVGYGASGTVNQTGGTLMIPAGGAADSGLYLGNSGNETNGVYNLSGTASILQVLSAHGESIGGTFNQSGGVHSVSSTLQIGGGLTETFNLSGGSLTVLGVTTIGNYSSPVFNQTGGFASLLGGLTLDATGFRASATYSLSNAGYLWVVGTETVAVTNSSSAAFIQSGGTHSINGALTIGSLFGSSGTYSMSGGNLLVNGAINVGGAGTGRFNQTGGAVAVSSLNVGGNSASFYAMSNTAALDVSGTESIGYGASSGTVVFTQTGGAHAVGTLNVGGGSFVSGSFFLSGPSSILNVRSAEKIGGFTSAAGAFTQSDGAHLVGTTTARASLTIAEGSSSKGIFQLAGGTLDVSGDLSVGVNSSSRGSFLITGGSANVQGTTNVANAFRGLILGQTYGATGNGTMTGGTLTVNDEYIGASGTATFIQSGGTHQTKSLTLGASPRSGNTIANGTFTLSGGTLTVTGDEHVGLSGIGTFNQSGGTHTIAGTLLVSTNAGSAGIINLSGGYLAAASTANNGAFTQSGGTASLGNVSGFGAITLSGSNPTYLSVKSFSQTNVTISGGRMAVAPASTPLTNVATTLMLSKSGLLDLNNQNLLTSFPASTIRQYLINGYNAGAWNGTAAAIISTTAANSPTDSPYTLAYATGGSDVTAIPIPLGQTLVEYTLPGDADLSGTVDFNDFLSLQNGFGQPGDWSQGDFNYDGIVDYTDYQILQSNFGRSPTNPTGGAAPSLSVPEPTTLTLIALATVSLLSRRRLRPNRTSHFNDQVHTRLK